MVVTQTTRLFSLFYNVNVLPLHVELLLSWRFSPAPLSSSAGSSWLLSLCLSLCLSLTLSIYLYLYLSISHSFRSFLSPSSESPSTVSVRTVALKVVTKPTSLNRLSGLRDYHPGGEAGKALPSQARAPLSPLSSLFAFSLFQRQSSSSAREVTCLNDQM